MGRLSLLILDLGAMRRPDCRDRYGGINSHVFLFPITYLLTLNLGAISHKKHIMRQLTKIVCVILFFIGVTNPGCAAKKITIHAEPSNATISIDGAEVGVGTYTVKFGRNVDFYLIKVSAPGYLTKTFRLLKSNPNKTVLYKLSPDEALQNSAGGDDAGMDLANKWFEVTCGEGVNEDEIWKRLINVSLNYFDNIEIRDKEAGWIRSGWKSTTFTEQVVRTQMEVRTSFNSGNNKTYKVRITSEIRNIREGLNNYIKYNRVLNNYIPLIDELQTSISKGK